MSVRWRNSWALLDLTNEIVDKLPEMTKAAGSLIESFVGGILDELPTIVTTAFEIVMQLLNTIIEMLPNIIKTGMDVLIALITGISNSIPKLIPTIIEAVTMVKTLLVTCLAVGCTVNVYGSCQRLG